MTDWVPVTIPGGFEHDGNWRRGLWLRSWCGREEMLVFEQAGLPTPAACATALLSRCVSWDGRHPAGREFARHLSVGDREALMLQLHAVSAGNRLDCLIECSACGQAMDLELGVKDLLSPPGGHDGCEHRVTSRLNGRCYQIVFRLPNGEDIEEGSALVARNEDEARRRLFQRCVTSVTRDDGVQEPGLPAELWEFLSNTMAQRDPQAESVLNAVCVSCGAPVRAVFDAAHYVLEEVKRGGKVLPGEVYTLARVFHWSEADILRMSTRRRRRYLEFIHEGSAGGAGA